MSLCLHLNGCGSLAYGAQGRKAQALFRNAQHGQHLHFRVFPQQTLSYRDSLNTRRNHREKASVPRLTGVLQARLTVKAVKVKGHREGKVT